MRTDSTCTMGVRRGLHCARSKDQGMAASVMIDRNKQKLNAAAPREEADDRHESRMRSIASDRLGCVGAAHARQPASAQWEVSRSLEVVAPLRARAIAACIRRGRLSPGHLRSYRFAASGASSADDVRKLLRCVLTETSLLLRPSWSPSKPVKVEGVTAPGDDGLGEWGSVEHRCRRPDPRIACCTATGCPRAKPPAVTTARRSSWIALPHRIASMSSLP